MGFAKINFAFGSLFFFEFDLDICNLALRIYKGPNNNPVVPPVFMSGIQQ